MGFSLLHRSRDHVAQEAGGAVGHFARVKGCQGPKDFAWPLMVLFVKDT